MKPKLRCIALSLLALAAPTAFAESAQPASGSYECWSSNRANMGLNFTLESGGRYLDSERKKGSYKYDAASKKISFKGGALDGQSVLYETPKGKPKVSFRNAHNNEIAFCEGPAR